MLNPQVSLQASEGVTLFQRGQLEEAAVAFQAGIAKNPKDLVCLIGLVRVQLSQMKHAEAKSTLEQLLAVEPRHLEGQSHMSLLLAEQGDKQALEKLKAIAMHPKAGFFEFYNLAIALTHFGDDMNAEKVLEQTEKFSKQNPQIQFERGRIALRRKEYDKAVEHLRKAIEYSPRAYAPRLMLARVFAHKGDLVQAIKTLSDAIQVIPGQPALFEEMFTMCMLAGSPQQALKAAVDLCQTVPDNARYMYLKGLAELTTGDAKGARATLEAALELEPTSWEIEQTLARTYELLKEPAIAKSLLEEAVRDAPKEPGPANDLAIFLLQQSKPKEAREVLEPVLAANPDDPAVNLNMALALKLEGGNRERALECARKAQSSTEKNIRDQATQLIQKL